MRETAWVPPDEFLPLLPGTWSPSECAQATPLFPALGDTHLCFAP